MRVVFGLHLDSLNSAVPRNAAGEATLGPMGFLKVLETQLGLPTPDTHPSEASFSYLQCLREASTPDRFFHRSLEIDPINVARTLLDWRAQWYEAGWDGTFPDDAPARLADMAAVETIARNRVPPTHGERLQAGGGGARRAPDPDRAGRTSHAFRGSSACLAAGGPRLAMDLCARTRTRGCRTARFGSCAGAGRGCCR